jgi:hypothetical protein
VIRKITTPNIPSFPKTEGIITPRKDPITTKTKRSPPRPNDIRKAAKKASDKLFVVTKTTMKIIISIKYAWSIYHGINHQNFI